MKNQFFKIVLLVVLSFGIISFSAKNKMMTAKEYTEYQRKKAGKVTAIIEDGFLKELERKSEITNGSFNYKQIKGDRGILTKIYENQEKKVAEAKVEIEDNNGFKINPSSVEGIPFEDKYIKFIEIGVSKWYDKFGNLKTERTHSEDGVLMNINFYDEAGKLVKNYRREGDKGIVEEYSTVKKTYEAILLEDSAESKLTTLTCCFLD